MSYLHIMIYVHNLTDSLDFFCDKIKHMAIFIVFLSFSSLAQANDSAAVRIGGQLEFKKNNDINMLTEDLFISAHKVRVTYTFRNESKQDIEETIAFPIHEADWSDTMGEAERAEFEKYFVGDIAFKLTSSAVVSPVKYELKIKDSVAYITYYWTQKFPAGKIITVSHEYIPAGGLDTPDKDDDWNGFWKRNYVDLYCIEPKLNQWVLQYRKWAVPVHYILTTGANWKAPIGHFKLTIKKETPEQKVSLCVDNIKKIDDMTFQLENNNFLPDSDLNVLFIDTPIDVEIKN